MARNYVWLVIPLCLLVAFLAEKFVGPGNWFLGVLVASPFLMSGDSSGNSQECGSF